MSQSPCNLTKSQVHILCFAREAGGAEALAPVIKQLCCSFKVLLLAKDYAVPVFKRHGLEHTIYSNHGDDILKELLYSCWNGQMPDIVLTSATSLPWNDMTERLLWSWAHQEGIPSIGVVDQWQNYGIRFSGCSSDEHLAYLPTRITALDEHAKQAMVEEGIAEELIVVTGQPALDGLFQEAEAFSVSDRGQVRRKIGAGESEFLILFISEAFQRDFADSLGYDEKSTLEFLVRACTDSMRKTKVRIHLVVKLHMQNTMNDFAGIDLDKERAMLPITIVHQEIKPRPLALASDLVVGMTSVLLVESILMGLPTVSVTLNSKKNVDLIAVKAGALPLLRTEQEAGVVIQRMIAESAYKTKWMERQKLLGVLPDATGRVVKEVANLLHVHGKLTKKQSERV